MTKEKRRQKEAKRKLFRLAFITIVGLTILLKILFSIFSPKEEILTIENGIIEEIVKTKGIIIKKEQIYKSDIQGEVTYLKNEGDKVAIGTKILTVTVNSNTEKLKNELKAINKQIENLKENNISKEVFKDDINKNSQLINILLSEIQKSIVRKDYFKLNLLRNELNFRLDKDKTMSGEGGYVGYSIERLMDRKTEIMTQLESFGQEYYSDKTGILSYEIDGLEDIYSIEKIDELEPDDVKFLDTRTKNVREEETAAIGESLFKIIDNLQWYIIAKVDSSSLDTTMVGNDVDIRINNSQDNIPANVLKIDIIGDKSLVVLKMNSYFYRFSKDRYVDVKMIKRRYEGLKIPKTAIVEKDAIQGVYIKDISNIVKFRPIQIEGEDETHAIVNEGNKINLMDRGRVSLFINGNKERRYTIAMYDKIIVNGSKVEEGTIID